LVSWQGCPGCTRQTGFSDPWRNNMSKTNFLTALFLLIFASVSFASQINRITLSELHAKADLIMMAEVTKIVEEGNHDHVTIKADLYLKGKSPQTVYTFTLVTRGGLKDFDPSLKKGDTGVFFLKLREQEGQVEKAYWGSVATFQKNLFDLTEKKMGTNASIITSVNHPDHTDKQWVLFENGLYKFVRVDFGHDGKQSQGFYVFTTTQSKWLKIDRVTTLNAVLGRSPTFGECRKANKAPPSVGWDFRSFKEENSISLPLRYGSFIAFPDNIAYDNKTWFWILSFMSSWNIKGAKTVLKFKHADLDAAFSIGADSAKEPKGINLATPLDTWRSYRVKLGQARNIKEYERGFRKGFTGPPGLVDGSADFNLGHSDGMLAKMKKFPNQQDESDGK